MMKRNLLAITVASAFTTGAQARAGREPLLHSYEIECLDGGADDAGSGAKDARFPGDNFIPAIDLGSIDAGIATLFRIGKQIWTIVEANRPISNFKDAEASVLPAKDLDWQSLSGWKAPETRSFRIVYRNGYRVPVVTFGYRVQYTYGGTRAGQGLYLARVAIVPEQITVMAGYTFDAEAGVPSIVNMGSDIAPVAGAEVQLKWRVRTVLMDSRHESSYFVDGRGGFRQLSSH